MKQEDKELLLTELSSRIRYGLKVCIDREGYDVGRLNCVERFVADDGDECWAVTVGIYRGVDLERIRPYLRPMSNMTDDDWNIFDSLAREPMQNGLFDWLNSRHFDYRGLIEKGLALEAPEGMYNK